MEFDIAGTLWKDYRFVYEICVLVQSEIARATQPTEVNLLIIMCVIVSCTSMYDCVYVFVNTGWRT